MIAQSHCQHNQLGWGYPIKTAMHSTNLNWVDFNQWDRNPRQVIISILNWLTSTQFELVEFIPFELGYTQPSQLCWQCAVSSHLFLLDQVCKKQFNHFKKFGGLSCGREGEKNINLEQREKRGTYLWLIKTKECISYESKSLRDKKYKTKEEREF
jgi:hypothetical protein